MEYSNQVNWKNMTFSEYCNLISDDVKAYCFSLEWGLVDTICECDCGSSMTLISDASKPSGRVFQCSAGRSICRKRKSALSGSWLANSRLGIRGSLLIVAGYAANLDYSQMRFFFETASDTTIADWKNYFRNICSEECVGFNFEKIGGPECTVEIDESLVFKRKNHVGRLLYSEQEHIWVVGGISRDTREAFAIVVPDRSAPTLEQAIIQHVLPGTRIITDCWAAYSNLERLGYFHETVNHSRNFVNTNDPTVYTNTIERHWGLLKQIIPRQTHGDLRYSYLAEYIWKMKKGWFRLSIGERIKCILNTLKDIDF